MKKIKMELVANFIKNKVKHIREMLKGEVPKTDTEQEEMLEYVLKRLDEVGHKNTLPREMYSKEDKDMLSKFYEKEPVTALVYAVFIGFANGVKYERKNFEKFENKR
ncbi:MAG: hypothetical protein NC489_44845 [Ruminococcus flavefaciens]|nr:hypothetical protein [Ruminococcus flavefaciens]